MNIAVRPVITDTPLFFQNAVREIGTREEPENKGPAIRRYISLAHCGSEGDPWCAIFANAMIESAGMNGTRSALARSFEKHPKFIKLMKPVLGCVVTFWRKSKVSGLGHVGFYNGEINDYVSCVGGNESDMVREEMFPKLSNHFGLSGYYWPKDLALPSYGAGACPPFIAHGTKGATGKVV